MIKKIWLIVFYVVVLSNTVLANSERDSKTLGVPLKGYALTCTNDVSLSVLQNDIWQNANTELPVMGMYYLNGKYYGHSMCDVVTCQKIENSYDINLVEYQKVGEKESPYPNNESGLKPIFKQVPLDGRIKVLINFYSDEKCTQKTSFEKVIDENKS